MSLSSSLSVTISCDDIVTSLALLSHFPNFVGVGGNSPPFFVCLMPSATRGHQLVQFFPFAHLRVCFVFCVLCFVFCVLCFVFGILCVFACPLARKLTLLLLESYGMEERTSCPTFASAVSA
jgi:hypothetical protein